MSTQQKENKDNNVVQISEEKQKVSVMIIRTEVMISLLQKIELLPKGITRVFENELRVIEQAQPQNMEVEPTKQ